MPFGGRIALRRLADRGTGVVDQDVEPAKTPDGLLDHCPARTLIGDVEPNEGALTAGGGERRDGRLTLLGVARRQHHRGSRRRETPRHAEPDAAIAAGDHGDAL